MNNDTLVIVPVYNMPQELLHRCLGSINAQTFRQFSIAVVNDGSDEPIQVHTGNNTFLVNKVHSGQASSLNMILKTFDSFKYWCTVGGDDTVKPNYLERLHAEVEQPFRHYASPDTYESLRLPSILDGNYMHGGALFRYGTWKNYGPLDEAPLWDWDWWARIAYYGIPGVSVPENLYNWIPREGSVSRSMDQSVVDEYRNVLKSRYRRK